MIDLRRLHVLRAVDHYGTVTAAAQALHFTPSAASQQIRQLGRELGVALLEPEGRRVRLTPAAHRLLAHADDIQARWELAERDLRTDGDEPAGLLRLAGFPTAVTALLAPAAAALVARHPRLVPRISEGETADCFDLLFDGHAELAVVEATPDEPPRHRARFDQQPLVDDPFDLVVPPGHRLAGRDRVELAEAADEPWVVPAEPSTCRTHVLSACGAAGFAPDAAHEAVNWDATLALVAHGLGVALVPRMARATDAVVRLPCAGQPRRKLLTVTRPGGRSVPAVAAALAALERLVRTMPA
ncbi:DNA-binding transcriptional LysR family regulator [Amycolatopsis bartoniae]|uniref:LysR family transcriptional regulator n=1 Tax=Amycolatopsis bartoniae TaxID=941986 RepID=A0A8H9M8F8_9PSEU|nr:LysR family transcriptional regulator [Amycolatopsis bartoniae]MBB2938328.1 DNA-binding transcriptional LysR family regulator [Amycolatopsis bartoniae]TVT01792.1 LysR family transcriptional regulator [Amycolatopsis bartoniae]GHF34368.1 LysR family transcriptional regulator [Amycolatopsis bartoniae]